MLQFKFIFNSILVVGALIIEENTNTDGFDTSIQIYECLTNIRQFLLLMTRASFFDVSDSTSMYFANTVAIS